MTNPFEKVAEAVWHGIEWPFKKPGEFIALIEDGIKDEPVIQAAVVDLIKQAAAIPADVMAAVASDGFNIPADLKTIEDVKGFFAYFVGTFVPTVAKVASGIAADVKAIEAPVASAAPAVAAPGLHAVTAD